MKPEPLEYLAVRLYRQKQAEREARAALKTLRDRHSAEAGEIPDNDPDPMDWGWCDGTNSGDGETFGPGTKRCYQVTSHEEFWCEKCVASSALHRAIVGARRKQQGLIQSIAHRGRDLVNAEDADMSNELAVGDMLKDNDQRQSDRPHLTVIEIGTKYIRVSAGARRRWILRRRIYTDDRPRKNGFSRVQP